MSESLPADMPERLDFQPAPGLTKLLLRNFFYGLLTLGFYRFWARTNLRRYLWGAVRLQDEPLEYTGTGRELFVGFLIVLAVFIPVSIAYAVVQLSLIGDVPALAALDGFYFIALVLLVSVAQFRARRYRLSRTLWRGIRAGQGGSSWVYLGRSAIWLLAAILTLGLCLPWALVDLARYRMQHSYWGSFQGDFAGTANQLVMPLAWVWGALISLSVWSAYQFFTLPDGVERLAHFYKLAFTGALLPIFLIYFQIVWLRWYIDGLRLGPLRFKADFSAKKLFWYLVLGALGLLVVIGILGMLFFLTMGAATAIPQPMMLLVFALFLPVVWVCLLLAYYHLMFMPALRRVILGVVVIGMEAALQAQQAAPDQMRSGEGLADSFDVPL